jgi:serine/threonine-protein kinase RsbW
MPALPPDDVRVVDIDIPSDVAYIEKVVELVRHECEVMDFAKRQLMLNVPVALTEALSNAILRGNGDDPAKHVHVRAEVDTVKLVVEVADEGAGFDFDAKSIDPTTPDNLDREDGRGLFLMRKLMDRVERVEVANGSAVRMTLRRT